MNTICGTDLIVNMMCELFEKYYSNLLNNEIANKNGIIDILIYLSL